MERPRREEGASGALAGASSPAARQTGENVVWPRCVGGSGTPAKGVLQTNLLATCEPRLGLELSACPPRSGLNQLHPAGRSRDGRERGGGSVWGLREGLLRRAVSPADSQWAVGPRACRTFRGALAYASDPRSTPPSRLPLPKCKNIYKVCSASQAWGPEASG